MADSTQATSENQTQPANPDEGSVATTATTSESTPSATDSATPAVATSATPPSTTTDATTATAEPEVPDTYEIKAPEGVKIDPAVIQALAPAFKEGKLSQKAAQGIADAFITFQKEAPKRMLAADLETVKKDPELGGMNLARTQAEVNTALSAFTTPEERDDLQALGIANRLSLVRMFQRVGRAMTGDQPARGQPDAARTESVADRLYRKSAKA